MFNKNKQKWVVTSAWPYVNAIPHLGNMIGSVLSADVFARYLRSKGDEVVFVSGSDAHGTPVAVEAKKKNLEAKVLASKNHAIIKDLFEKWNISYDNYTETHNLTHQEFVQYFYLEVQNNNFVKEREIESFYCEKDDLFLPDRFIEGVCPHCSDENARGDQCDKCQKLLTPTELKQPRCVICNNPPVIKKTRHWYMEFPKLQEELANLIEKNDIIPPNAKTVCLNSIKEGLPERSITRDLEWGIPAKFEGAENKTIYVWFEAVLGYISAVKEWAEKIIKKPKKFQYFWNDPWTKTVFFIGKDNIIFHLIVFPGLLLAYNKGKKLEDQFVLPYNVSSTEFLMYENDKFSKSRGVGIWIDQALELAPVDYWRFSLIYSRPEKSDTSFLWSEFENHLKTLNDNIGNFIHRTLTFTYNKFNKVIPKKNQLDEIDSNFIERIDKISEEVGNLIEKFKLKKALKTIVNFSREGNVYLNTKAPWKMENKDEAGHIFYICAQAVYALAILLGPFIPGTSQKILEFLNISKDINKIAWNSISQDSISEGTEIKKPKPLFQKLEIEKLKEKCEKKMNNKIISEDNNNIITYDDFSKLDLRIGLVEEVEKVAKADELLKLTVDIGTEKRVIVAGLAEHYKEEDLKGKKIVVLTNLAPRKLRGISSQGMLLAADDGKNVRFLTPESDLPPGSKIS
ncbi:MAG: methionine--tRNA ligase [Promethearchaeota archaeon]